jgi:hypothetical protein
MPPAQPKLQNFPAPREDRPDLVDHPQSGPERLLVALVRRGLPPDCALAAAALVAELEQLATEARTEAA